MSFGNWSAKHIPLESLGNLAIYMSMLFTCLKSNRPACREYYLVMCKILTQKSDIELRVFMKRIVLQDMLRCQFHLSSLNIII